MEEAARSGQGPVESVEPSKKRYLVASSALVYAARKTADNKLAGSTTFIKHF
jgi:hypothetical protein